MSDQVRKTKIICSVSKKVNNYQAIKKMILAGGNFLRYSLSLPIANC